MTHASSAPRSTKEPREGVSVIPRKVSDKAEMPRTESDRGTPLKRKAAQHSQWWA